MPVLALVLLGTLPASASLAYELDVEALTGKAELVVRAQVVSSSSRWVPGGRRIVTESVLRVKGLLKGASGDAEVHVVQPGGSVDGVAQHVSGAANFTDGEEVLVFLTRRPGAPYTVVGMAVGKYRVRVGRSGRLEALRDGLDGVVLLGPDGRALPETEIRAPRPYSELVQTIQAAARGEQAQ